MSTALPSPDETLTFQELRISLTAFAIWSGMGSNGDESAVEIVDRFLQETALGKS